MGALFDRPVEPCNGAPQSVYSHHFIDRGPGKVGWFLEVPPVHPMLAARSFSGFGEPHQALLAAAALTSDALIAIAEDGLLPDDEGGTVRLRRRDDARL